MTALCALALTVLAPLPPSLPEPALPGPALLGPPAICHPFAIGEATSLPWSGTGGFSVDRAYSADSLAQDTVRVLDGSADPLVHMETLRRATIYASELASPGDGESGRGRDWREARAHGLGSLLRDRVLALECGEEAADARQRALAWLDLGYFQGALGQAAHRLGEGYGDPTRALDRAVALAPGDAAFELGWVLASWHPVFGDSTWEARVATCVKLAEDGSERLRASQVSTLGPLLDCRTHAELVLHSSRRDTGSR